MVCSVLSRRPTKSRLSARPTGGSNAGIALAREEIRVLDLGGWEPSGLHELLPWTKENRLSIGREKATAQPTPVGLSH